MTADEFEAMAAERRHVTVAEQRAEGQVVVPCNCDYVGCDGWRLTSKHALALDVGGLRPGDSDRLAAAMYTAQNFDRSMRQIKAIVG